MRGLLVELGLKLVYGGLGSRTEGAVGLGGLLVGLGLKLVSATRLRSHGWVAGCGAAGLRCLGLGLGGLG